MLKRLRACLKVIKRNAPYVRVQLYTHWLDVSVALLCPPPITFLSLFDVDVHLFATWGFGVGLSLQKPVLRLWLDAEILSARTGPVYREMGIGSARSVVGYQVLNVRFLRFERTFTLCQFPKETR